MKAARALVQAWLVLDFFGDARRTGGVGSSLTTTVFSQSFLALVVAALLWPDTPPVPFAAANLCLSSLLVAIGALGDHDLGNRRRADRVLVETAPLPRHVVVLARAAHGAFYTAGITLGMALPPAILLGMLQGSFLVALGYLLAAVVCSGMCTAALALVVRGLGAWLGEARATLLAGTGKALLLGFGVALFALGLQRLQLGADALPIGRLGAELLPPYHAARLLTYPHEAWRLLPFLGGAAALFLVALALPGATDEPTAPGAPAGWLRHLLRRLAGRGPRLAVAEFVAVSMWRNPGFRSRVLPLLGLPAGMVFLSLRGGDHPDERVFLCLLLQLPAIYLPFLIGFLPRAEQLDAGWVFDQAPDLSQEVVQDATWRAVVTHVLLPVQALAFALAVSTTRDLGDTLACSLFAAALAVLAARPMVRQLGVVPFTAARDGDGTDLGGLFTFALGLGGLGAAFGALATGAVAWLAAAVALAGAVAALRHRASGRTPLATAAEALPQAHAGPQDEAASAIAVKASLGREVRALLCLYAACSVLPWLYGVAFA